MGKSSDAPLEKRLIPSNHLSAYLLDGQAQERYVMYDRPTRDTTSDTFQTETHISTSYRDPSGYHNPFGPHLNINSAATIVSQSVVAHYCKKLGITKHEMGELIGTDFSVHMRHPIPLLKPVVCSVRVEKERRISQKTEHGTLPYLYVKCTYQIASLPEPTDVSGRVGTPLINMDDLVAFHGTATGLIPVSNPMQAIAHQKQQHTTNQI